MYGNMYAPYNPQNEVDKLNMRINEMEKIKSQLQQQLMTPPAINQTFQLAPNSSTIKYANNIEDVKKELVSGDTPFFSNDLSVLWIKNTKGDIKSYEIHEIVLKDDKDLIIEGLMAQIEELKKDKVVKYEPSNEHINESIESKKSNNVQSVSRNKKKQ